MIEINFGLSPNTLGKACHPLPLSIPRIGEAKGSLLFGLLNVFDTRIFIFPLSIMTPLSFSILDKTGSLFLDEPLTRLKTVSFPFL